MNPVRGLGTLLGVLFLATAAGCAGYRVGPTGGQVAGARSVRVAFFRNETLQPLLPEACTQALRRQLQQDGTLRLTTGGSADIEVEATLVNYQRLPLAYQPSDVASVSELELRLTARVVATEKATGRRLLEREVVGRTTVLVGDDLDSTERQAVPLLANDLARNTTTFLVEGSW